MQDSDQQYSAILHLKDEDGMEPFKTSGPLRAANDSEAKVRAREWAREAKPKHYEGTKITLKKGNEVIWSISIRDLDSTSN